MGMPERERIKIGVRVDKQTYEKFVDYVEDKYGRKEGILAVELEKALRRRMNTPEERC
jgi:hypothetical protein